MNRTKIISDNNIKSKQIKKFIFKTLRSIPKNKNKIIIVIGGDGFMLQTLKRFNDNKYLFYGINSGNYGFLMNQFSKKNINKLINSAKKITIHPLEMNIRKNKKIKKYIAINEVSILRQSRQAAYLSIKNNKKILIKKLICDGVLVSTPAGSTAYNSSVYGPILSLNSKKISVAPISAFRPRRWKGKVVSENSNIVIKNLDFKKRPISAVADNVEVRNVTYLKVKINKKIQFNLLYDRKKSLHNKIQLEKARQLLK